MSTQQIIKDFEETLKAEANKGSTQDNLAHVYMSTYLFYMVDELVRNNPEAAKRLQQSTEFLKSLNTTPEVVA